MKPIRIQRKRVKGWKMPENTIRVTRPGKWGNPFKVGNFVKLGNGSMYGYAFLICWDNQYAKDGYIELTTPEMCVETYEKYQALYPIKGIEALTGKNLACFCKPGARCHADILLKLANP